MQNFKDDNDDEGTIWFSDTGAEEKVLDYLEQKAEEGLLIKSVEEEMALGRRSTTFLDLGTGNGHMLFALQDAGFEGVMMGVDYSDHAVRLAQEINRSRNPQDHHKDCVKDVYFQRCDILSGEKLAASRDRDGISIPDEWDVVLDKGTFDAISLSPETDSLGRRDFENYPSRVKALVNYGGLFIITSCNWTQEELIGWFAGNADPEFGTFKLMDSLKYAQFKFGGKSGQSVVTLVFVKKKY